MKILVDGYWLPSGPPSGRMVVQELVQNWQDMYPSDELVIAIPVGKIKKTNFQTSYGLIVKTKLRAHPIINGLELPAIARRHNCDVILAQNFAPLRAKSVLLIHDVLFQSNPQWFTWKERLYCSLIPIMARFQTLVVTTTATETLRIKRHNPKLRIGNPIGLGISSDLMDATSQKSVHNLKKNQFVLTVSRLNIRKNLLNTILGALNSNKISSTHPLVIVGEKSGAMERWPARVQEAVYNKSIIFTGYLTNAELRWLYENCLFFCFLSLDEGFGLPPVEALSFGAETLVSDIKVMHENLGNSCSYVDPLSINKISEAFIAMIETHDSKAANFHEAFRWNLVIKRLRTELEGLQLEK